MMSNAGTSTVVVAAFNVAGRLLRDPFWQPDVTEKMAYQNHLTFTAQLLNVYGMWVIKMSICTYLLNLHFSKEYRWVVWVSSDALREQKEYTLTLETIF
jgi:hypothetical protein